MANRKEWKTLESSAQYTVGWITALALERAAALVMLDERHNKPKGFVQNKSDENIYTWGRIADHDIVIASLPAGECGTVAATATASGLLASLPHIRIGLFVGIGAGVPSEHKILLGDVVVSNPDRTNGGVVQYDLYKAKQEVESGPKRRKVGSKERKGFLNSPPRVLRHAITALQAEHEVSGFAVGTIMDAFRNNEIMRVPYGFPGADEDPLRRGSIPRRMSPAVHYGTIASGNTLLKKASERDELVKWLEDDNIHPLCFEMEAAGLMNSFPCLVIRGICDYADEHKNDIWQRYAAATAAAFGKELLGFVDKEEVVGTAEIGEVLLQKVQDIRNGLSNLQSALAIDRERFQLQSRLPIAEGATYDSHQDEHSAQCLEGTRTELLRQVTTWFDDLQGKSIFWLCGMAGTGKSTIARTVGHILETKHGLGASFFFKRGESDRQNARRFVPTIAKQLADRIPSAGKRVAAALDADSLLCERHNLQQQFEKLLLEPFSSPKSSTVPTSSLVIVIDALDECERGEDVGMILRYLSEASAAGTLLLRIFVTSRPELPIQLGFRRMDGEIHHDVILEEVQANTIAQDIRMYFNHRFKEIQEIVSVRNLRALPIGWPGDGPVERLVDLAVPLFIFAFTICRYVSERDSQGRLEAILRQEQNHLLSGLSKTYLPILQQTILGQDVQDRKQVVTDFKEIVGAIVLLADPLPATSLSSLLETSLDRIDDTLSHLHSLLSISPDAPVRLLHLSFRDFLVESKLTQNGNFQAGEFHVDADTTHHRLAVQCLRLLGGSRAFRRDMLDLRRPGIRRNEVTKQKVADCIPGDVAYACSHWALHIFQSKQELCDDDQVHQFLQRRFLHWLEALSWLGRLSSVVELMTQLHSCVKVGGGVRISAFLDDGLRFIRLHWRIIDLAPLQLYYAALVFTPTHSIIRETYEYEASELFSILPDVLPEWSAEVLRIDVFDGTVKSMMFSPDGRLLVSGSHRTVRIWDVATGEERLELQGHQCPVAFSSDGTLVATVVTIKEGDEIRLWDAVTREERRVLKANHRERLDVLTFSPDGKLLASGSDGTVSVWDVVTGKEMHRYHGKFAPAFSSDGRLLAMPGPDLMVEFLNVVTGQCRFEEQAAPVRALAYSPNGRRLATVSLDGTLRVFDTSTTCKMVERWDSLIGTNFTPPIAFSPDGQLLACLSSDNTRTMHFWDAMTHQEVQSINLHDLRVNALVFSPKNGKLLAFASSDDTIRLWNTATSTHQKFTAPKDRVVAVGFSPTGKLAASVSDHGTILIWDAATGKVKSQLETFRKCSSFVHVADDGRRVATLSRPHVLPAMCPDVIEVWDVPSCSRLLRDTAPYQGEFTAMAFSPNCKLLAFSNDNGKVRVLDTSTGVLKKVFDSKIMASVHRLEVSDECAFICTDARCSEVGVGDTQQAAAIELRSEWVCFKGEEVLWLPRDYRGLCSAVHGNTLVIGQSSGAVSFFKV